MNIYILYYAIKQIIELWPLALCKYFEINALVIFARFIAFQKAGGKMNGATLYKIVGFNTRIPMRVQHNFLNRAGMCQSFIIFCIH